MISHQSVFQKAEFKLNKKVEKHRIANIAKIKYLIDVAGLSGAAIEKRHNLYSGCVYDTMRCPNKAGEEAIAGALDKKASDLWPERYDPSSGLRLEPQPVQNYYRPPSRSARQKKRVA